MLRTIRGCVLLLLTRAAGRPHSLHRLHPLYKDHRKDIDSFQVDRLNRMEEDVLLEGGIIITCIPMVEETWPFVVGVDLPIKDNPHHPFEGTEDHRWDEKCSMDRGDRDRLMLDLLSRTLVHDMVPTPWVHHHGLLHPHRRHLHRTDP